MVKIAKKVISTILSLKDEMSAPLRNVSQVISQAKEKIREAKEQVNKFSEESARNTQVLNEAKARLKELERNHSTNTEAIRQAKEAVEGHQRALEGSRQMLQEARRRVREHTAEVANNSKKIKEAQKKMEEWGKSAVKTMDNAIAKTVKWGAAFATATGALAMKTGFSEAFDMEGYRMQLETATKDTQLAGELMANAVKFANSTPFETGSVVGATAKMEAYGLSSKKWLVDIADMAGATNKGIDQATEAMADAVMGEWERLKEFGIKKEMLVAAAAEKYGNNVVFNKKGQVLDQVKLEDILQKTLREKFQGGAAKMANTARGLWSTITGVTKSAMASIVGINESGVIQQGTLFAMLKEKMQIVVDLLNKWMEDGTIQKIGKKVTETVGTMINIMKFLFETISEYRLLIEVVMVFAGTIYTVVKAMEALKAIMVVVNIVTGILNGTLLISPLGWVALAVGAVVAVLYILWRNFDTVKNICLSVWQVFENGIIWLSELWNWFRNLISEVSSLALVLTGPLAPLLLLVKHFDKVKEAASKAFGWMKKVLGFDDKDQEIEVAGEVKHNAEGEIKNKVEIENPEKNKPNGIESTGNKVIQNPAQPAYFGTSEMKGLVSSSAVNKYAGKFNIESPVQSNSTRAYEPSENKIQQVRAQSQTPASKTEINVTLQGDFYGFEDFKEKVAEAFVKVLEQNRANVVGVKS